MIFSIIVPVYNVEAYLEKCLESIRMQTFSDYEVLLIDDGSTDGSGKICDAFGKKDRRIRVFHQENRGLSEARNTGLSAAQGEWIVFIDSDDWVKTDMLEILAHHIRKTQADLYSFNVQKVDNGGCFTEKLLYVVENEQFFFCEEKERFAYYVDVLMQYGAGWEVWNRIFRRELIGKHHLKFVSTQKIFAEDYLFTFQYLLHVQKIESLCDVLYYYRQRGNSLMGKLDEKTVLKRLFCFADLGYESVKRAHLRYFCKNYDQICFMLLNHHIRYKLSFEMEEIRKMVCEEAAKTWRRRRWFAQMCRKEVLFDQYMENKKWLTKRNC